MDSSEYYRKIDPSKIITPADLNKPLPLLLTKIEEIEKSNAPKMLIRLMFSLTLEIEMSRRNGPAVLNPENPEPMILSMMAVNTHQILERAELIRVLRKSGWIIKLTNKDNLIEISVKKLQLAKV